MSAKCQKWKSPEKLLTVDYWTFLAIDDISAINQLIKRPPS